MRIGINTIPPQCMWCGLIDSPEFGKPVECYPDNRDDPKWPDWLCTECRTEQWHNSTNELSLREFLGQTELEHKYWVEGKWDLFVEHHCERLCGFN